LNAGVLILLATAVAYGQGATAQISGTVKDTSGGVLPGVDVTVTQTATGLTRSAVTDEGGNYTLTNLPIGPYRLEAKLSGFRTFVQTGITLTVNANPVLNVEMALGDLTETVSVEAATPLVETRSPSIGTVIDNEKVEELPLNGRNPVELIQLAGAAVPQPNLNSSSRSMQGGQAIAVAGSPSFGIAYTLDGANHNNAYDNLNLPLPFPDAMQEFRVETSAQNAQNGFHSGAAVNVATKSGTNLFHADVFEFYRNHRFNATNPFNAVDPATGERRDDGLKRNQFGGTMGGPIKTDRMFFFGAYQGTITSDRQSDRLTFVPTAAMLAGDFTTIASEACRTQGNLALPAALGFAGNRIDPSLLSPAAVAIAKRLPAANDACGRTSFSTPRDIDEKQAIGKIDYNLGPNHSIFGRYIGTTYFYEPPFGKTDGNVLSTILGGRDNLAQSLAVGDTRVLSNTTVNNLRFSFNRTAIHRTGQDFFGVKDVGINTYSYTPEYMLLNVSNAFSLGGGTESEATFKTNTTSIGDDLTMIRGNHQWGFGTMLSYWNSLSKANVRSPGTFSFDGSATGLAMADFLLGRLAGTNGFIQSAPNTLDMEQWYFGVYMQDVWKLRPTMTLNYGLRWEPWFPQQQRNGAIYHFDTARYLAGTRSAEFPNAPPGFTYPGDDGFANGNAGMEKDWTAFAPRVGFAWDPKGDGKQSVRVGYSLGNEFVNGQFYINTANAPPWGSEVRLNGGLLDDPFRTTGVANIFPVTFDKNAAFSLNGPYLVPPADLKNTKVHAWDTSDQKQIGSDDAVSASYLGNYTVNLWDVVTGNPGIPMGTGPCTLQTATGPRTFANCSVGTLDFRRALTLADPAKGQYISNLDYFTDHGTSLYNGLLVSWQHRAGRNFSSNINYTLSKCTGFPSQGGTTPNVASGYMIPVPLINPPANGDELLDQDKGPCDWDRRHVFNATASVQSPESWGVAGSGWRLSGILRAFSGGAFSVTTGTDRALTGNPGQQRVNQVLDDPYGAKTVDNWLNPAAFAQPAFGAFGNSGRNAYRGPGQKVVDLSLVRSFRFSQTHRIEARLETFNAFNWFRKNNPVSNLTSTTFGRVTTAGDPRIMQFALKYSF
jgi:hypothetical protein